MKKKDDLNDDKKSLQKIGKLLTEENRDLFDALFKQAKLDLEINEKYLNNKGMEERNSKRRKGTNIIKNHDYDEDDFYDNYDDILDDEDYYYDDTYYDEDYYYDDTYYDEEEFYEDENYYNDEEEIIDVSDYKEIPLPSLNKKIKDTNLYYDSLTSKDNNKNKKSFGNTGFNNKKSSKKQNEFHFEFDYKDLLDTEIYMEYFYNLEDVSHTFKNLVHKMLDYIDEQLRLNDSNLNKLLVETGFLGGYSFLLKNIISVFKEATFYYYKNSFQIDVNDFISQNKHYLGSFYNVFNKKQRDEIFEKLTQLLKQMPPPDEKIRDYFNLNENNLPILWWDMDGEIRVKNNFTPEFLVAMSDIRQKNKVFKLSTTKEYVIVLFSKFFNIIKENLYNDDINFFKNENRKKLLNYIEKKGNYYAHETAIRFLNSLFDKVEIIIKELIDFRFINILDIQLFDDFRMEPLQNFLSQKTLDKIIIEIDRFTKDFHENERLNWAFKEVKVKPSKWKNIVNIYNLYKITKEDKINVIKSSYNLESMDKLANGILKTESDVDLRLILLVILKKKNILKKNQSKELLEIIDESQYDALEKIAKDIKGNLNINEILALRQRKRRKISLNKDLLKESKENLNATIDKLNEFIKDDEDIKALGIATKKLQRDSNKNEEVVKIKFIIQKAKGIEKEEKASQKPIHDNINNQETKAGTKVKSNVKSNVKTIGKTKEETKKEISKEGENKSKQIKELSKMSNKDGNINSIDKDDDKNKFSENIISFLKELLKKGSLSIEEVEDFSKKENSLTNSFISKINKELFYLVDDEIIIIDGIKIIVDDFYIDDLKEFLNGKL